MSGNKLLESLKIKECDRFPSRVSGHCNWESIRLIKSHLTPTQIKLFKATCFGHFLDVSDMVLSGQFCHHILLRECHVKNVDDNASSLWYHVGNGLIRFSLMEFNLVSGLAFAEYSESTSELFKQTNSRLRRTYFQGSKVKVKMIVDWFRNLGPNNKISDDDVVKLALILLLEMTLGSFIYARTFNSLSTCLHGRDDKFKIKFNDDKLEENVDGSVRRKGEKYNVYGFLTAFQVWAVEAIPKWVTLGYAIRVNNVAPRILNWQCTGTPSYADILKTLFKFKNITVYRTLGPTDEETRMPYWTGVDKLKYVSPNVDGCVGEDDVEDGFQDDVQDDVDDVAHDDIDGDHPTKTFKKVDVGGQKK
ncbi:hypothetical protein LWI29_012338 [Acer saccharum]|uniref:DUF1985 domain-containing protein n=1 Tax=Acer saccharum TaxID=4024 RepID=A0AA39TEP7_ACESA|nr:hypothetical protein LWI29_012338 [Acer saccharum]